MSWKTGEKWQMCAPIGDTNFYDREMPYRWWLWDGQPGDPLNGGLAYSDEDYTAGKIPGLLEDHPDLRLVEDPQIGRAWICFGCGRELPRVYQLLTVGGYDR